MRILDKSDRAMKEVCPPSLGSALWITYRLANDAPGAPPKHLHSLASQRTFQRLSFLVSANRSFLELRRSGHRRIWSQAAYVRPTTPRSWAGRASECQKRPFHQTHGAPKVCQSSAMEVENGRNGQDDLRLVNRLNESRSPYVSPTLSLRGQR